MQVESIRLASAEREAELTSKLEDHEQKARDRRSLDEQVIQIQKDLQLAHATIAELVSFAMCFEFFSFFSPKDGPRTFFFLYMFLKYQLKELRNDY